MGMDEVRTVLAIVGPTVALLSIVGMLVTAQNSHWFTKLVRKARGEEASMTKFSSPIW